jgi:hypothetical protein
MESPRPIFRAAAFHRAHFGMRNAFPDSESLATSGSSQETNDLLAGFAVQAAESWAALTESLAIGTNLGLALSDFTWPRLMLSLLRIAALGAKGFESEE